MSIDEKVEQMSQKYKELRALDNPKNKQKAIADLRKLASEAYIIMAHNEQPSNTKKRRQIEDVLKKCETLEAQLAIHNAKTNNTQNNAKQQAQISQSEIAKQAVHSVIMHQIRSSQLQIKPEQYDAVFKRMVNNLQVMKEMEKMVYEQGNDIDKVNDYLDSAYQNVGEANQQLTEANQIQKQTRRMKFRLAFSGFFAALGYKLLGLPGMVMGFFFGHKAV